ncbi:hypothetical protein GJ496_010133 [Pomphorhynchus laevis]|nr:hypothetical protein GJ496_010133 [Pomphorhynchus laevis]
MKVRCLLDLHSSLRMLFVERKHSDAIAGKPLERPEATRQALCHLLDSSEAKQIMLDRLKKALMESNEDLDAYPYYPNNSE